MYRSRWPCNMPANLARFVFSQSCSWLRSVVARRLPIIVLTLSFNSATSPRASTWMERVKSPLVTAVATSAMARTCVLEIRGQQVDVAGEVFPGARRAGHGRLAAEPAFDAHFAGDVRHLVAKRGQGIGHVVDRFGQRRHLALGLHDQLLPQVAVGHGRHHLHDAADLVGKIGRHDVDRVGKVLPGARHAGDLRLSAELAVGAHFAGDAGDFGGESVELVDHRVDRVLQLQDFALARPP